MADTFWGGLRRHTCSTPFIFGASRSFACTATKLSDR